MRDPNSRSSIPNDVSAYDPKWVHDFTAAAALIADDRDVSHATTNNDFESEYYPLTKSRDPSLKPERPTAEPPWRRGMQSPELRDRAIFRYLGVVIVAALVAITVTLLMPAARYNNELNSPAAPTPAQALTAPNVFPTWPQVSVEHQSGKLPTSFAAPVQFFVEVPLSAPSDRWYAAHPGLGPVRDQPPTAEELTASATEGRSKLDPNTATSPVNDVAQKEQLALVTSGNREPSQDKPDRPISQEQIRTLLNQGQEFVSVGDISTARILFARVAEARDARGALAMAATYDPVALGRFGVKGVEPDINKAREWYQKAMELGSPSAASAVEAMTKYVQ